MYDGCTCTCIEAFVLLYIPYIQVYMYLYATCTYLGSMGVPVGAFQVVTLVSLTTFIFAYVS